MLLHRSLCVHATLCLAYLDEQAQAAKLAADRCAVCSGAAADGVGVVVVAAHIPNLRSQRLIFIYCHSLNAAEL